MTLFDDEEGEGRPTEATPNVAADSPPAAFPDSVAAEPPPLSGQETARLSRALYEAFTHSAYFLAVMRALDEFIQEQQVALGVRRSNGEPLDAGAFVADQGG
jgi:hypothetical protein